MKKKTRTEAFTRNLRNGGRPATFGDAVGGWKHEHEWGVAVENEDGESVKTCLECGIEVEELVF